MTRTVLLIIASGSLGGGTTHVLQLARGLPRHGFRPVVVSDPDGPLLDLARAQGCDATSVPMADGRNPVGAVAGLRRVVSDVAPAIVHAHGARAGLMSALAIRSLAKPRVLFTYTEHGLAIDVERAALARAAVRWAEAEVLRTADRILAVSEYGRTRIAALSPALAAKVRVVGNVVGDLVPCRGRAAVRRELGLPEVGPVVGTVARFVRQKAPLDFVAMAAALAHRLPDVGFLAVGDGELLDDARAAARNARVDIAFTGPRTDIADLLGAMDVFVLVSRWEGMPISVLEAMAAGVPVIATAVGGTPTVVVQKKTGVLVAAGEPLEVADAVAELLADEPRARCLAANARALVRERHREEDLAPRVAAVYREILGS